MKIIPFVYNFPALSMLLFFMMPLAFSVDLEMYVISHGHHSGIILSRKDINLDYIENSNDYSYAQFIEFGFGDKEYYMSEDDPTLLQGAEALFWSSGSVMHVVKINDSLKRTFPESNIYRLKANRENIRLLNRYIFESFKYHDRKNPPLGKSLYLDGNFYDGSQTFSALNTCNTWVANALQYAGYDINPSFVTTQYSLEVRLSAISEKM
jgi:uncharacterized protein (TIGR02117 family)